ncbi:unnamed protein product [Spirodela intermedia]|uniref:Uncharacterized protein n=1 Tax=Spirodela intermedia TaxID=51605 RepID=A0A7I8LKX1_SPIIN|nr:unnamed protein product [Spirodela intermedia]
MDSSGSGKIQASQLRSQSQQQFSQGPSLSQLSQSSLDDVLTCDQRLGSQERENTAKRFTCLAPITSSRDESQMQLSRTSNNFMRRSNSASTADQRCHVSEELELRVGLMESSLTRLGRILDSIQSDVMQVNKAVKEVLLEVEGMRQKTVIQDSNVQLMLKGEEEVKASLAGILKSIPDQLRKQAELTDQHKFHAISTAISSIPARIEGRLLRLQHEICGTFSKELEKRCFVAAGSQKNHVPITGVPSEQAAAHFAPVPARKAGAKLAKLLEPEPLSLYGVKRLEPKQEEILPSVQVNDYRVIIESDEEMDGAFSCLLEKHVTGSSLTTSFINTDASQAASIIVKDASLPPSLPLSRSHSFLSPCQDGRAVHRRKRGRRACEF